MRRYGTNSDTTVVPGKDAGLAITLQPLAVEPTPCEPAIAGLFWFSDSTGLIDQEVEAAYLLAEGAAGPVLGLAKLLGETCDLPVTWTKVWTPSSGTGGDPGYMEDGASLIVYPMADTAPGVLEVTAEHGGTEYGPILLTVLRHSSYCYAEPCEISNTIGGWFRLPENFAYTTSTGSTIAQYGGPDGAIVIGTNADTTINYSAMSGITQVYVYCNDGGNGYFVVNNDGVNRSMDGGLFSPPWLYPDTPVVTVSGISSLRLVSDGYGSPFYVFVR